MKHSTIICRRLWFLFPLIISCQMVGIDDSAKATLYGESRNNQVTQNDVLSYITSIKGVSATKASEVSIEPILNGRDTVMYLLNYEDGWELLSGDYRLSHTLMKSNNGSVSVSELSANPDLREFMNRLKDGISSIMHNDSFESPEEARDTWEKILSRGGIEPRELIEVLVSVDTVTLSDKYQDHLMVTSWGQGSPWNQYAPFRDSTRTSRCLTGCVPVAAAQVLYYLHNFIGVPVNSYGTASCNAYVPQPLNSLTLTSADVSFSNYGNHWGEMPLSNSTTTGADKVSALMVWLGYLYQATYRYSSTGAWSYNATSIFPNYFSVSCDRYDINNTNIEDFADLIETQVYYYSLPIIMDIWTNAPGYPSGHAIVVDGYHYNKQRIDSLYAVYDVPLGQHIAPGQLPSFYYPRSVTEESTFVAINWGWNGSGNVNTTSGETIWYNMFTNWIAGGYNFTYLQYAIYNFAEL